MSDRRLGTSPTRGDRLLLLEQALAVVLDRVSEQQRRIEALEARDGNEDGALPQPLGSNWAPLKQAAATLGLSPSGLRKRMKRCGGSRCGWARYRAGRLYVDTTAALTRRVRT
jgi:hypothetical protein